MREFMNETETGSAVPLDAVAALGGRSIDARAAAAAVEARLQAADGLAVMRSVPLPFIGAVEPLHHAATMLSFISQTSGD